MVVSWFQGIRVIVLLDNGWTQISAVTEYLTLGSSLGHGVAIWKTRKYRLPLIAPSEVDLFC